MTSTTADIAAPRPRVPGAVWKTSTATATLFLSMAVVSPTLDALVRQPFGEAHPKADTLFMMAHSAPQILLLGVVVGILSDRAGRRIPTIATGLIGTGVATALLPWISSFPLLLALRFLDGLFGIAAVGLLMARVVDLSTPENRARCMAVLMGAIPVGYLAGMLLSAALGDASLRALFGAAGILVAACGVWMLPEWKRGDPEPAARHRAGLRDSLLDFPKIWFPMFAGFVDKMTFAAIAMLTSLAVRDVWGRDDVLSSGLTLAAYWLAFLAFARPAARVAERFGAVATIAGGSVLYGLAFACLAMGSFAQFVALMIACGALTALQFVPIMTLVGDLSGPERRAANMGAFNLTGSVGIIVGFAVAGILYKTTSHATTYLAFGILELGCAAAGGAYLLLRPAVRGAGKRAGGAESALNSRVGPESLARTP